MPNSVDWITVSNLKNFTVEINAHHDGDRQQLERRGKACGKTHGFVADDKCAAIAMAYVYYIS